MMVSYIIPGLRYQLKEKTIGDDCIPQESGGCYGDTSPSDYTALLYLSDIFDGTGHFYFMDKRQNVQSSIIPKCGRLLGFAGTNSHGVNLSWKSERCVIVMAMSRNKDDYRPVLVEAADFLRDQATIHTKDAQAVDNEAILKEFYNQGVTLMKSDTKLLWEDRLVADGLANTAECLELLELARKGALPGDGYDTVQAYARSTGVASPHSKHENFTGLNISRSLKLVESNTVSAHGLRLFLDVSEMARLLVASYLHLTRPLYFEFTHLVCRTPIAGEAGDREEELSHPVHSDNCDLQDNGTCIVADLGQRHYSAILYLNEDFEGGEFFFAHSNKSEQISVQPKPGRLVAFKSGDYHGVKGVRSGSRCAIAMWYSLDPDFNEVSRLNARRQLDIMKTSAESKQTKKKSTLKKKLNKKEIIEADSQSEIDEIMKPAEDTGKQTGYVVHLEKNISKKEHSTVNQIKISDSPSKNLHLHHHSEKSRNNDDVDIVVIDSNKVAGDPTKSETGVLSEPSHLDAAIDAVDTTILTDSTSASGSSDVESTKLANSAVNIKDVEEIIELPESDITIGATNGESPETTSSTVDSSDVDDEKMGEDDSGNPDIDITDSFPEDSDDEDHDEL